MKTKDPSGLRPFERRLLVGVGLVLFIVLNFILVIPHFSDLNKVQFRASKARRTLDQYQAEIRQVGDHQKRIREMGAENATVPVEEQSRHFSTTRESVATTAGVTILNASKVSTRTNQFFLELSQTINLVCREQQLVNFLYNLGAGNSLIRVRELSLKPDPTGQQLGTSLTLAASYQKKAPVKTQPSSAPAARPTVRTGAPPAQTTSAIKTTAPASKPTPRGATTSNAAAGAQPVTSKKP